MEIRVSIPLVGGKIESLIADLLLKALKAENAVGRQYLTELTVEIPLARTRFDLFATFALVVYAAILTGLVAAAFAFLDGVALLVVLIVLVLFWLFHSGLYVFTWTRMRKVAYPLGLHGDGLHARSQFGELIAPWETIQSVAIERAWNGRRLRIRLVPPGDPRHAGIVHADLNPKVFEAVDRRGMRYSLRVLDIDLDELRQAFVVQSGGRVQVS